MRKYAPIAALAAMSLVLAACGGGDNTTATGDADESTGAAETTDDGEAAPSGDQITLNLWTFGNFGYDELIEEYEADNPNVMIETLIQEFDPHHDALITSLAAGTGGPDIAAAEVAFIGAFANQPDSFLNVQEYAAPDLQGELPRLEVGPGDVAGRLGHRRPADRRRWPRDLLPDGPVRGGRAADRP
jgi:cellobiose transport system substrate-binding protein